MGVGGRLACSSSPRGRAPALAASEDPAPSSLQGWVFNVVPWLVAIPASLFSGLLSDRLINQGEPWGRGWSGSHAWALPHFGGRRGTPPGVHL